jgi:hypothetical protein
MKSFAQSIDTTKVTEKAAVKKENALNSPVKENLHKQNRVLFDKFIDMDGDGICDSRGKSLGLRSRLLSKNIKLNRLMKQKGGKK